MKKLENQILKKKRTFTIISSITAVLTILSVCFIVNIAYHSDWKYDMTNSKIFTLSDNTMAVVDGLKEKVKIGAVYPAGKTEPMVDTLLQVYEEQSDKLEVIHLDAEADPSSLAQFNLGNISSITNGTLIVEAGNRVRLIRNEDLFSYTSGGNIFYGESEITGALRYVTLDQLPVIYFTAGHGEVNGAADLTKAIDGLMLNAYDAKSLVMLESGIPEDADILALISPETDIDEHEKNLIKEFLNQGGKLLLLTDPFVNTAFDELNNLSEIVTEYGIDITNNYVVEKNASYYASSGNVYLIPRYGSHEITFSLAENQRLVVLPLVRGIGETAYDEKLVTRTPLLASSDQSFVRNNPSIASEERTKDDMEGPIALGAAASKSNNITKQYPSRVVVIGDSDFITDANYEVQANADLFINSINWLMGERTNEVLSGKVINSDSMIIRGSDFKKLVVICCVIIPMIAFSGGFTVWLMRRNQ